VRRAQKCPPVLCRGFAGVGGVGPAARAKSRGDGAMGWTHSLYGVKPSVQRTGRARWEVSTTVPRGKSERRRAAQPFARVRAPPEGSQSELRDKILPPESWPGLCCGHAATNAVTAWQKTPCFQAGKRGQFESPKGVLSTESALARVSSRPNSTGRG